MMCTVEFVAPTVGNAERSIVCTRTFYSNDCTVVAHTMIYRQWPYPVDTNLGCDWDIYYSTCNDVYHQGVLPS